MTDPDSQSGPEPAEPLGVSVAASDSRRQTRGARGVRMGLAGFRVPCWHRICQAPSAGLGGASCRPPSPTGGARPGSPGRLPPGGAPSTNGAARRTRRGRRAPAAYQFGFEAAQRDRAACKHGPEGLESAYRPAVAVGNLQG